MKSMSPSLLLLGAFTLLLLSIINPSMFVMAKENRSTNNNFAHDTFNRFQFEQLYKLYISEVDSDPRKDLKSNLTGILIIFVNHTTSNFKDNVMFLQREIKSGKLNGETKEMYDTCLENFERGTTDLQQSMHVLLTETGKDIYGLPALSVASYVTECVDDFEGVPKPPE